MRYSDATSFRTLSRAKMLAHALLPLTAGAVRLARGRARAALIGLFLLLPLTAAVAQARYDFVGVVQWVSGGRVQLRTNSGPVNVDVSRLDQSAISGLRTGDLVRVVGVLAPDRIRIVAEALEVWPGPQAP